MDNFMKMGLAKFSASYDRINQSFDSENREQKKITDFSIKRILEDSSSSNKTIKKIEQFNYVLDLSKTKHNQGFQSQQQLYQLNPFQKNIHYQVIENNNLKMMQKNPISAAIRFKSETIVKPKVYKPWEPNILRNCNDCEIYFKNMNYHHQNFVMPTIPIASGTATTTIPVQIPKSCQSIICQQRNFINNNNNGNNSLIVQNFISKTTKTINSNVMFNLNVNVRQKSNNGKHIITGVDDDDDEEISHKCQFCDKVFGCASTLESHEKTHKSPRYECLDCGKGFSQLRNYKYHLSVHRGTKEFAAECPECGKVFNDKGYLSSHMKIHRNKKEYECPYCPKSFNQRVAFNMHVRIHTGVKPHKCNECGKRFSRKMLLKQHMRTHSGEKPYQCTVCGKSFADRSNMTLHHRLHSGIKPFTCPICPKAFTKKHHLKTHLNYHTGCKPYVCPHPNCNQAFTQSSNMRTHSKKCQFRPVEVVNSPLAISFNSLSTE